MFSKKVIAGTIAVGTLALIAALTGGEPGLSDPMILPAATPLAGNAAAPRTEPNATTTIAAPAASRAAATPDVAPPRRITPIVSEPTPNPSRAEPSKPKPAASTSPAPAAGRTYGDHDCADFGSQAEAQRFFVASDGPSSDPHKLDRDNDGIACESI